MLYHIIQECLPTGVFNCLWFLSHYAWSFILKAIYAYQTHIYSLLYSPLSPSEPTAQHAVMFQSRVVRVLLETELVLQHVPEIALQVKFGVSIYKDSCAYFFRSEYVIFLELYWSKCLIFRSVVCCWFSFKVWLLKLAPHCSLFISQFYLNSFLCWFYFHDSMICPLGYVFHVRLYISLSESFVLISVYLFVNFVQLLLSFHHFGSNHVCSGIVWRIKGNGECKLHRSLRCWYLVYFSRWTNRVLIVIYCQLLCLLYH